MIEHLDNIAEANERLQAASRAEAGLGGGWVVAKEADLITDEGLRFVAVEDGTYLADQPATPEGANRLLHTDTPAYGSAMVPYPNVKPEKVTDGEGLVKIVRPQPALRLPQTGEPNRVMGLDIAPALEDLRKAQTGSGIELEVTDSSDWYGGAVLVARATEDENPEVKWQIAPPGSMFSFGEADWQLSSWRIKDPKFFAPVRIGSVSLRKLVDALPDEFAAWAVKHHQEDIARIRRLLHGPNAYVEEIDVTLQAMAKDLYEHMHRDEVA